MQGNQRSRQLVMAALAAHRQLLSQRRARIRTLTAARNEALARAIEDGLAVSTAARVLGETVPTVRRIALSFDQRPPTGTASDEHIAALRKIADELVSAAAAKAAIEGQLEVLVVQAYRMGFTDKAHLAGMAGISGDQVHRSLRGHRLGRSKPRHSADGTP